MGLRRCVCVCRKVLFEVGLIEASAETLTVALLRALVATPTKRPSD